MGIEITNINEFKNDIEEYEEDVLESIQNGLERCGQLVTEEAKRRVCVDTGELQRSIGYSAEDYDLSIFAEADHAIFEEMGTRYRPPHPYLQISLDVCQDEILSILEAAIGGN